MTEPPITIVYEDCDAWRLVHVRGEIDSLTAPALKTSCIDSVRDGRCKLIVNLSEVPFIDSAGLNALIAARRAVETAEGQLRIVTTVPSTLRLLRITGLDRVFDVYPDLASAQKAEAAGEQP